MYSDEFATHADMTLGQKPPLASDRVVEQEIFDELTRQQLEIFQLSDVGDVDTVLFRRVTIAARPACIDKLVGAAEATLGRARTAAASKTPVPTLNTLPPSITHTLCRCSDLETGGRGSLATRDGDCPAGDIGRGRARTTGRAFHAVRVPPAVGVSLSSRRRRGRPCGT